MLIESNLLAPILTFLNTGSPEIINHWFGILAKLSTIEVFMNQFSALENLTELILKALQTANKDTNKALLAWLINLASVPKNVPKMVTKKTYKLFVF